MKINFKNKKGESVMEIDSMKKKDISVLSESLKDLAKDENVENKIKEKEDDEEKED